VTKLNAAQQLRTVLGIESSLSVHKQRQASYTKSGPGRRHVDGTGKRADKTMKQLAAGGYGHGLRNAITRQNLDMLEKRVAKKMAVAGRVSAHLSTVVA
jgi:hypothetical protein